MKCSRAALSAAFALTSFTAIAAEYPAPQQGDWIARDFKFHTGETIPELRLHYTTVGEPTGPWRHEVAAPSDRGIGRAGRTEQELTAVHAQPQIVAACGQSR